ncbi:XRE family transcriptional regulator [Gordonia sp. PKS22-38]|uniref:XRE family transcriptional regulator n=1 Tax=Gordonia prachuapensis TaxID=3115651 RepID=A0ABU7MZW6_9ACTN|nr:XRE family transcriptional regulator [Gordonia sp. PKS22-38]
MKSDEADTLHASEPPDVSNPCSLPRKWLLDADHPVIADIDDDQDDDDQDDDDLDELSKEVIENLKARGYNQTQIADMYGVTRQAVSWHLRTYGGRRSVRQIVGESWPWETSTGHDKAVAYRYVRDHAEYVVTGGEGMGVDKLTRLRSWHKRMRGDNLVVEFDPSFPPLKGVAAGGGFRYVPRVEADGDLLIRVNEFTTLVEGSEWLWSWPVDG